MCVIQRLTDLSQNRSFVQLARPKPVQLAPNIPDWRGAAWWIPGHAQWGVVPQPRRYGLGPTGFALTANSANQIPPILELTVTGQGFWRTWVWTLRDSATAP